MQSAVQTEGKYYLKSLYQEIDLYDRKLAHLAKYENFASDAERESAIAKMTTKRARVAQTAMKLVEDGVAFEPSDLPRSMRPTTESVSTEHKDLD